VLVVVVAVEVVVDVLGSNVSVISYCRLFAIVMAAIDDDCIATLRMNMRRLKKMNGMIDKTTMPT